MAYFDMGGYAMFVWSSYGVAAVVMVALFIYVRATLRSEERTLAQLQAAGGGRRRRARGSDPSPDPNADRATVQEDGDEHPRQTGGRA